MPNSPSPPSAHSIVLLFGVLSFPLISISPPDALFFYPFRPSPPVFPLQIFSPLCSHSMLSNDAGPAPLGASVLYPYPPYLRPVPPLISNRRDQQKLGFRWPIPIPMP